jgi:hypothetical protein
MSRAFNSNYEMAKKEQLSSRSSGDTSSRGFTGGMPGFVGGTGGGMPAGMGVAMSRGIDGGMPGAGCHLECKCLATAYLPLSSL